MKYFIFHICNCNGKFISAICVLAETEEEALRLINTKQLLNLHIIKGDTIQLKNTIDMDERWNY
jgi:hypothetical protein